jgi:hypothetical protein
MFSRSYFLRHDLNLKRGALYAPSFYFVSEIIFDDAQLL